MKRRLIVLSSLKRNPEAGRTEYTELIFNGATVTGGATVKAVMDRQPRARLQSQSGPLGRAREQRYTWLLEDLSDALVEELRKAGATFRTEVETKTWHSIFPEPAYVYRFAPFLVTCEECGSTVDYADLTNDVCDDGYGGESFCPTVCPKCNHWMTLDVEDETPEEALLRKKV